MSLVRQKCSLNYISQFRSTDGDFIHANVDIDLIISEDSPFGNHEKPTEIFHIIEHFCLGRRRLHLFGRDSTIRPGTKTGRFFK